MPSLFAGRIRDVVLSITVCLTGFGGLMTQSVLTFSIDKIICAVPIGSVLEVLNYTKPTVLPGAEKYIEGLVYSREQGVTVVNLRKRFGLKAVSAGKNTRILVIEKVTPSQNDTAHISLFGALTDTVNDVVEIDNSNSQKQAKKKLPFDEKYVQSICFLNESLVYLLNIDTVFETVPFDPGASSAV
jgi:purine-binding chemotaxis protein CheW